MDISLVAIISIVALLIVVIISCINEDLNVGFLAIGFAIIVAGVWGGVSGAKVLNYFPTSLFMILVGVTFLFGMAQTNGTMEKLTAYSLAHQAALRNTVFLCSGCIAAVKTQNDARDIRVLKRKARRSFQFSKR